MHNLHYKYNLVWNVLKHNTKRCCSLRYRESLHTKYIQSRGISVCHFYEPSASSAGNLCRGQALDMQCIKCLVIKMCDASKYDILKIFKSYHDSWVMMNIEII